MYIDIKTIVFVAGMVQISIAIGSVTIPGILKWRQELLKVQPLIAQIFWVYAVYILTMNLSFGLLSVFACNELVSGSKLALFVTGFICIYWVSRVSIQFFYFKREHFPVGKWHTAGETLLVTLFIFLSIAYGWAFYHNYTQL